MTERTFTAAEMGALAARNKLACSCDDPDMLPCVPCDTAAALVQGAAAEARWEQLKADIKGLHGPALRLSEQEALDSIAVLWRGKSIAYETALGVMARLEKERTA